MQLQCMVARRGYSGKIARPRSGCSGAGSASTTCPVRGAMRGKSSAVSCRMNAHGAPNPVWPRTIFIVQQQPGMRRHMCSPLMPPLRRRDPANAACAVPRVRQGFRIRSGSHFFFASPGGPGNPALPTRLRASRPSLPSSAVGLFLAAGVKPVVARSVAALPARRCGTGSGR